MKPGLLIASFFWLAACASAPVAENATPPSLGNMAEANAATEALPAQTLSPGTCGLFLWTRDEPRRFILFYPAGSSAAEAVLNGKQTRLTAESQGGDIFAQFMTELRFRSPEGILVRLSLEPGEQIEGGRRVPSASMISQDAEGWEIVVPLAGLTACQPE